MFARIIELVWTSSVKIAKLLRTDDRQLVFALRRRMYYYLIPFFILTAAGIVDIFFFKVLFII
jgi:hypothetical protein